jgi:serine/threonine-protein kinase HipA
MPRPAPNKVQSLDVRIHDTFVGTLVRTPGGYHVFDIAKSYQEMRQRPTLSLSLLSPKADGSLVVPKPISMRLPPLFANMLPEGKLREAMEKYHGASVRPDNDFDLMTTLGGNLPGAVVITPTDGVVAVPEPTAEAESEKPSARFSLAGVQMKLSVFRNTNKGRGLTVALDDEKGNYIVKFPSFNFPALTENEFAMLSLATAVGMDVPEHELLSHADFQGVPEEFAGLTEGKVLLVKRFDRGPDGQRIHMEDFAQILRVPPLPTKEKYEAASSMTVAKTLLHAASSNEAIEFVRRLAFSALVGNGDMHLKNWSVIYRGDGVKPTIAPVYDFVSTKPYLPQEGMGLTIAGERAFEKIDIDLWRRFARKSSLPEGAVVNAVEEITETTWQAWKSLPQKDVLPGALRSRIEDHLEKQVATFGKKDLVEGASLPTP